MPNFKNITREELKKKIDSGHDFILLDVLGENSYKNAHLPGAEMVDAHKGRDEFLSDVESIVGDKSKELVVYCGSFSCQLSPKAASILSSAGYQNVYDFEGGLKDWAKGGYSLEGEKVEEIGDKLRE